MVEPILLSREKAAAVPRPDALLAALGQRVRGWRAQRGMTRKLLAHHSGLSERFLADVEAGRGNVSLNSLQAIAQALGVALHELLPDAAAARPQLAQCIRLLERLDDAQLADVRAQLERRLHGGAAAGRERRIALVGLRGAGKTTLGRRLAKARGVPFVELDREIEREAGTSLNDIFLLHGQAGYRRYEQRALRRVARAYADGVVMTTGGSLVSERGTYELLLAQFTTIWVKARPEEHMARVIAQGDLRPMSGEAASAEAMEDLKRILESREPLYARADAVVDTSGRTVEQSLRDLLRAAPEDKR